ncbi:MAG: serine/threonine protein kinase [Archangium sp.]|nr:serine/threonine protein kinase [Archangium sp.]
MYVSGQQLQCSCGIRFEVRRSDVKSAGAKTSPPSMASTREDGTEKTIASSKPTPPGDDDDDEPTSATAVPRVPGYELLELLGKGGMGEVWRARQVSLSRNVAVKLLPPRFAKDKEFVTRFEKEATALAALSHPGVVQIIDRGQAGEHYFFVMELVPGINLREMMNNGKLTVRDSLRIGAQVARAIDYAHEMKVVHRDLKPENILVDSRGHVKIADFGLAGMKGSERDIALTATAVAMGTVNYMAPEQRRDAKHVDHRADLYSLGVLLYEMLTGELPIGRFKMPSQRVPSLDPSLDEVICSLLESEPDARPQRANLIAEALEAVTPSSSSSSPSPFNSGAHPAVNTPARPVSYPGAPGAPGSQPPVQSGGWKLGVFALGALLAVGVAARFWPADEGPAPISAPPAWYHDSDDEEIFSAVENETDDAGLPLGGFTLSFDSEPDGGEELNLHAGMWTLENGVLSVLQYGDALQHEGLVPRAYVAHRYYSADRFEAAVDLDLQPLPAEFPAIDYKTQQHFGELAFRINDVQVSLFAIPGTDARVGWRYFRKDGRDEAGNSSAGLQQLQEDPVRVPNGKFRLKLKLTALKGGDVTVEAFVNSARVTKDVLPGLGGRVGKVALGCRNHLCRFDNLSVTGTVGARPTPRSN